jgi:hypothetical protein
LQILVNRSPSNIYNYLSTEWDKNKWHLRPVYQAHPKGYYAKLSIAALHAVVNMQYIIPKLCLQGKQHQTMICKEPDKTWQDWVKTTKPPAGYFAVVEHEG